MRWRFLTLIAVVCLVGCGGAGTLQPVTGEVMVTTSWPHYNAGGDALAGAESVTIEVVNGGGVAIANGSQNRPPALAPTGLDLVASSWTVSPASYSVRVTAFDGSDGSGARLGQRVFTVSLGTGQQMAGLGYSSIPRD